MTRAVSLLVNWRILLAIVVAILAGFLSLMLLHAKPASAVSTPPGFTDTLVASVGSPMALAFTPDGRLLVAGKSGRVRVYKNEKLLQTPALNISSSVCAGNERGLLGMAVDPDFGTAGHNYLYLYYSFKKSGVCPTAGDPTDPNNPVNRVSRFTMSGDTINPSSEDVLIDNIPSPSGNHNAGHLSFGKDGYLYVSVGDGQCDYTGDSGCSGQNDASRDPHVLLGKILRITRNGGIPAANPYQGTDSARCNLTGRTNVGKKCQETFASGLRNPFRFAFDPDASGTRFFINDVGQNGWEEVDQGESRADYGWNLCEGTHDNPARAGSVDCTAAPYTPPIHEYSHNTGCSAITGGAFVPNGFWPAEYDTSYLFGDYVCNKIFKLTPDGAGGFAKTEFASGLGEGGPIAMAFGPHGSSQALYYTTSANGGEVRSIAHTVNANRPPTAALAANPTSGSLPLAVDFDGSGSSDPDAGDTLTSYLWDFGDGTTTQTTTTPRTSHTYTTDGKYTATLTVKDSLDKLSDPATIEVFPGNTPPKPVIESPADRALFKVGESITLTGSATDAEDDADGDSTTAPILEWEVLRWHGGNHTHPVVPLTEGNNLTFVAPAPEELASTDPAGNYLEIRLTAKDSQGLYSETVVQALRPRTVDVSFETLPFDLKLRVNGATLRAPSTLLSWAGYELSVAAPRQKDRRGRTWAFSSWSDGGTREHIITTPDTNATYTATFRRVRR